MKRPAWVWACLATLFAPTYTTHGQNVGWRPNSSAATTIAANESSHIYLNCLSDPARFIGNNRPASSIFDIDGSVRPATARWVSRNLTARDAYLADTFISMLYVDADYTAPWASTWAWTINRFDGTAKIEQFELSEKRKYYGEAKCTKLDNIERKF